MTLTSLGTGNTPRVIHLGALGAFKTWAYQRDSDPPAVAGVVPGTPGLEHVC